MSGVQASPEVARLRFWNKVDSSPGHDACWPWLGCAPLVRGERRGRVNMRGRSQIAAHVAWELYHAARVSPRLRVLHTCDNPRCCNPNHLWTGTVQDNAADMVRKGRQRTLAGTSHYLGARRACKNGHDFDATNTRLTHGRRGRVCVKCTIEGAAKRCAKEADKAHGRKP